MAAGNVTDDLIRHLAKLAEAVTIAVQLLFVLIAAVGLPLVVLGWVLILREVF